MKRNLTLMMTIAVLAGFGIIMMMNMAALVGFVPSKYISPNDVRGMAVEHDGLLYTLNFEQQNALVEIFNRSIPVTQKEVDARKSKINAPIEVQKIIIYRFNAPDIEILPVAYVTKSSSMIGQDVAHPNLVFSAPAWNAQGLLEEASSDELYKILPKTFDH